MIGLLSGRGWAVASVDADVPSHAPEVVAETPGWSGLDASAAADGLQRLAPSMSQVDLVGMQLRATGLVDLGHFTQLADYVNFLDGFFQLREVTILTRNGQPTRVTLANLRLRLNDVMLVGQKAVDPGLAPAVQFAGRQPHRLTAMTAAHLVSGTTYLHEEASLRDFVDANDPRFIPMTDIRVRWLADRRLAGRFAFGLLQRTHIVGVATGA
ncbi:MAG TPA: hypothetical protein VN800_05430 [Candidatus Acidoferrales bacterium]|nr:hypothetical protein [Candidatus Acidoferrales bacterium]